MDIIPEDILMDAVKNPRPKKLLDWLSEYRQKDIVLRNKNHVLVKVKGVLDLSKLDNAFSGYYHTGRRGTPATYTVSILTRSLLVGKLMKLSLRELEAYINESSVAKWFIGIKEYESVPDHSTLERFEQWVMENHPRTIFDEVLRQIDAAFPEDQKRTQIGDTYAMLARAAREDLVPMVRHFSVLLLEVSKPLLNEKRNHLALSGFDWVALFGKLPERRSDLLNKSERVQRVEKTLHAAWELSQRLAGILRTYPSDHYRAVRVWLGYLDKILADEAKIVLDEHNQVLQVIERPQKDKGGFRLASAADPDATYRVHGPEPEKTTLGYNCQVAASTGGFIRETQAYTGAAPDQVGIAPLIAEQVQHQCVCPPKFLYDAAGGTGKTYAQVAQASDGKTRFSAQIGNYAQSSSRYGPYDFRLSEDGQTLTCPNGKSSSIAYRSATADGRDFRFSACQCWQGEPPEHWKSADLAQRCPLWEQCRDARQGPARTRSVFISDYRQNVLAARQYLATEEFRQDRRTRPLIERVIFELTHYNDARFCQRTGLLAADWQAKMAAVSYNLKRWVRRPSRQQVTA